MKKTFLSFAVITVLAVTGYVIWNEIRSPAEPAESIVESIALEVDGHDMPTTGQTSADPEIKLTKPVENLVETALVKSNCEVQKHLLYMPDGEVVEAVSCNPKNKIPHPYESYPTESLEALAFGDSDAAEILGKRLFESNPNQAFEWTIRAAALRSGDYQPILWLVNNAYSLQSIDGEVQVDVVSKRLILAQVIKKLGGPDLAISETQQLLEDQGVSSEAISRFSRVTRNIVSRMAKIEYEVTGRSNIGEGKDA